MSTVLYFMYRDACNYKTSSRVIFHGEPSEALVGRLIASLNDGEYLVPEQVGLRHPALDNDIFAGRWPDQEDDHGWVEITEGDVEPYNGTPTDERTFEQFVEACERAEWDPMVSIGAAGGWQDPERCAALRGGSDD